MKKEDYTKETLLDILSSYHRMIERDKMQHPTVVLGDIKKSIESVLRINEHSDIGTEYPMDFGNGYKIQTVFANKTEGGNYGDVYDFRSYVRLNHPGAEILTGYCVIAEPSGTVVDGCNEWNETIAAAIKDYETHVVPTLDLVNDSEFHSYRFTIDYNQKNQKKSFQIGISSQEKPDSKWLAQKISNYFSVHYRGSVEKAINSIEGIDVLVTDAKGGYVDSDEIYGDDLIDLFKSIKTERYKLVIEGNDSTGEIHFAQLTEKEVNLIKKDIAGQSTRDYEITDEAGEKIEIGIIDHIERAEKPRLAEKIIAAEQRKPIKTLGFNTPGFEPEI